MEAVLGDFLVGVTLEADDLWLGGVGTRGDTPKRDPISMAA